MPKTVQIRDIDDDVYAGLVQRAAEEGVSVPEFLRAEFTKLASRPSMAELLRRIEQRPASPGTSQDIIDALDEMRGPWPDARR